MFLTIKKIPKVSWSSDKPMNFKPKISTFLFLCFGLALFGLGEGLLIVSLTGASPWSVLAQGISLNVDFSIGTVTFFISLGVLFLWLFLNQKPGIGTILNALIIALMIDICINFVPTPEAYISQILLAVVAVLTVGIGGGIFVSPILFLLRAGKPKHIVTAASVFILINSIFGIIGQISKNDVFMEIQNYWYLLFIVLIGGQIGNFLNLKIFPTK